MERKSGSKTPFDLSGKNALITGGAGLLGPEHGAGLARYSATVILLDLNQTGLKSARKRLLAQVPKASVEIVCADITDELALKKTRTSLERRGLPVDVLVNNAALNPKMNDSNGRFCGSVENYDMAYWEKEIRVGITGTFLCCKVFGQAMADRGYGVIINIASDLAVLAPDQRIYSATGKMEDVKNFKPAGYSVVKTAMLGLNRYLATYWAHKGVRVNCLVPGPVFNNQPVSLVKNIEERIPLRRWADKSEYQGALAFLASEASSYMTGQALIMDGGRSAW